MRRQATIASVSKSPAHGCVPEEARTKFYQETERWDVLASTFRTYAERYPNDPYTPTAQKLIGDALYKPAAVIRYVIFRIPSELQPSKLIRYSRGRKHDPQFIVAYTPSQNNSTFELGNACAE